MAIREITHGDHLVVDPCDRLPRRKRKVRLRRRERGPAPSADLHPIHQGAGFVDGHELAGAFGGAT